MRSLARRVFQAKFKGDLENATLSGWAAPEADLQELASIAQTAAAASDFGIFAPAARRLNAAGWLRPKLALKLATVLANWGSPEEALDLLDGTSPPQGREFAWAMVKAQAALKAGLAGSAQRALEEARTRAESEEQQAEVVALAALAAPISAADLESWPAAQDWIEARLDRRQPVLGAQGFVRALAAIGPAAAGDHLPGVCETAFSLLRLGDAAIAVSLLLAMEDLFIRHGLTEALGEALAAIRGRPRPLSSVSGQSRPEAQLLCACISEALAASGQWRAAIESFRNPPDGVGGMLGENLSELARCVGGAGLQAEPFRFAEPRPARIFDVFPFNGEFLMLEIKLAEMAGWVDKFVLVEAAETFTGKPKPLYFRDNPEWVSRAGDRIVQVTIERFPDYCRSPWAREFFQRDAAIRALSGLCVPSDVVIISDVDEISRRDAVSKAPAPLASGSVRLFNYYLNLERMDGGEHLHTAIARAQLLAAFGLSYLRVASSRHRNDHFAPDAGWHFSSVGSPAELRRKLASYSHTDWANMEESEIAERLAMVRRGELGELYVARDLSDDMPGFILENRERLREHLI